MSQSNDVRAKSFGVVETKHVFPIGVNNVSPAPYPPQPVAKENVWPFDSIASSTLPIEAQMYRWIDEPTAKEGKIGVVTETGFELDLNNMRVGEIYLVEYDGSKYEVMKNDKGELELYEVG